MADFFDKLKEQVTAGITTVTTKSRVAVETTRLRSQIRRIAKEKREALAQLGTRAYQEICERGHLEQDRIQEAVQRIQALDHSSSQSR
jgi:glutamate synthase domain-containing protein 2